MHNSVESTALVILALSFATGCMLDDAVEEAEVDEAATEVALPACAARTWCIEPTPAAGVTLHDVWVTGGEAFAVGDNGTILRRQNDEWIAMDSGTTQSLRGVSGTCATDVWAVGLGGTVLHFDGISWKPVAVTTSNLEDIWVSGTNVVFCGASTVWRSTNSGATFASNTMTGALFAISGVSANEIYVTGENSYVRQWNGSTWSTLNPGAGTATYFSVLAMSAGDVWVSDYTSTKETMHLVKGKWAAKSTSSSVFQAMHKVTATDVWGAGTGGKIGRWNGSAWTVSTPLGADTLWGVSGAAGHVFAVGANGLVGHYVY